MYLNKIYTQTFILKQNIYIIFTPLVPTAKTALGVIGRVLSNMFLLSGRIPSINVISYYIASFTFLGFPFHFVSIVDFRQGNHI